MEGRPVVASRVGGIQDQIEYGRTGMLLDDPHDLPAYGDALRGLLTNPPLAARLGHTAHERVRTMFLNSRHLSQYEALFEALL